MKRVASLLLLAIALIGCNDFFEKDIENSQVQLVMPVDGTTSSVYLQRFTWKPVDGAREYHIQLVTPSFDKIKQIILDTVTSSTTITLTLTPNRYQLSISAQNAGYQSKQTVTSFEITESYDLSLQEMNPRQPASQSATNASNVTFTWDPITGTTSYIFEIFDANGKSLGGAIPVASNSFTIPSVDAKISQLPEQAYSWRIFARNEVSDSKAAISRFTIDRTAPAPLKTIVPKESDTTRVVTAIFTWTKNKDTGSPISDSIIIASDQGFATVLKRTLCTSNNFSYTFATATATYFWKLKQSDAAGNVTETQPRKLLVLPL